MTETNKMTKTFSEVYRPKSPDEQKFVDKHVVVKHADRNGNGDDLFNAKNIKKGNRKKENHGYEPGDDAKVYEDTVDKKLNGNERSFNKDMSFLFKKKAKLAGNNLPKDSDTGTPDHFTVASRRKRGLSEDLETIEASLLEYFDEVGQEVSYEKLQELALGLQEEVLEELSNQTLKSYMMKAGSSALGKDMSARHNMKMANNANKTNNKRGDRNKYLERAADYATKTVKRTNGIIKAAKKIKEETQLDELSKPLLSRYINKSGIIARRRLEAAGELTKFSNSESNVNSAIKHSTKAIKRLKGISTAVNKLTKENLDNIINRYNQDEISLEEALVQKIAHLSEQYQALILTLFETLSEDNQELLFDNLDDDDGINETIDFALDAELNELSKETLKSYNKKALRSADKSWEKSSDEEDKAMSTDGEKYPDKQARHQKNAYNHETKYFKRTKGIERASQRLIGMMKAKK